jgi:hypothetical protein
MKRKVWVLDTSTKGTGASVVPLESTVSKPDGRGRQLVKAPKKPAPRPEKAPAPRVPRRFKVVDLVSAEVLAEGAEMRATLDLLAEVRSMVDVRIFVWDRETDDWRLLTLGEQRALWNAAHAGDQAGESRSAR